MAFLGIPAVQPTNYLEQLMRAHQASQALTQDPLNNQILADKVAQQNALAQYAQSNAQAENAMNLTKAQYLPLQDQSQLAYQQAMTGHIPFENALTAAQASRIPFENALSAAQTQEAGIKNKIEAAEIPYAAQIAQAKAMGGAGLGAGGKEQLFFNNLVSRDNPQLGADPDKISQATAAIQSGQNTLPDGTKLNVSPAAAQSLNRLTKYGTTSPLITQGIKAQQAEAELKSLSDSAAPYLNQYGDTYAGYSPQQIIDSMKTDDASQERLGKFIASQAAQYEIANIRIRIAQGETGVSAVQELMGRSGQVIDTYFPRLSAKAREAARQGLDEWLEKALAARQSVGINPSMLNRPTPQQQGSSTASKSDPLGIR